MNTSGVLVQQVAIGVTDRFHGSLNGGQSGRWLLYLSGLELYVSAGFRTPTSLTSGMLQAAWIGS